MYVARASWPSSNGKVYQSIYLRESYREGSHVRKRNIANLTPCDPQEIAAIELALRCKGNLAVLGSLDQIRLGQGPSVGALWAVFGSRFRVEITGAMQSGRNEFEIDIVNPLAEPADWRCRSTAREMVHHHQS